MRNQTDITGKKREVLLVRIEARHKRWLEEQAAKEDCSVAEQVRTILKKLSKRSKR
jgi:hypothetical protein